MKKSQLNGSNLNLILTQIRAGQINSIVNDENIFNVLDIVKHHINDPEDIFNQLNQKSDVSIAKKLQAIIAIFNGYFTHQYIIKHNEFGERVIRDNSLVNAYCSLIVYKNGLEAFISNMYANSISLDNIYTYVTQRFTERMDWMLENCYIPPVEKFNNNNTCNPESNFSGNLEIHELTAIILRKYMPDMS